MGVRDAVRVSAEAPPQGLRAGALPPPEALSSGLGAAVAQLLSVVLPGAGLGGGESRVEPRPRPSSGG